MYKIKFLTGLSLCILTIGLSGLFLTSNWRMALALEDSDVEISDDGLVLIITVNNPENEDLSWQYDQNIPPEECNENLTSQLYEINENQIDANQFLLNISENTYCFKITNEDDGQSIWLSYRITTPADEEGPNIDIRQNPNNLIIISSSDQDLDIESWQYASFERDVECIEEIIGRHLPARASNSLILRESDNNRWYCFKAKDKLGNSSFKKYKVEGIDATPPEIIIRQDGRLLSATLRNEETVNWEYVFSPSDVNCDEGTFRNNLSKMQGSRITLTTDRVNYYYCFRATDVAGNFGFAKYKIESVDFLTPNIRLEKINLIIKVDSDRPVKNWYYLKSDAQIECNSETNFETAVDFSETQKIILTKEDHQRHFCVKGVNSTNQFSFARIQVNTQIPRVTLKVDEKSISADANKEDLDWEYLKTEKEPDCNQDNATQFEKPNFDKHQGQKSQLNESDNGLWFCFRARDQSGNSGYAKKQIDGITTTAPGSSNSNSRGQTDILIITIILIASGIGFFAYTIIKKKREAIADGYLNPTNKTSEKRPFLSKHKETETKNDSEEEMLQPLDYLKKNKDE